MIENALKVKAKDIEKYSAMLEDSDIAQLKQIGRFENYSIVQKVLQILFVLNDLPLDHAMAEILQAFDLKKFVRFATVNMINPDKISLVGKIVNSE